MGPRARRCYFPNLVPARPATVDDVCRQADASVYAITPRQRSHNGGRSSGIRAGGCRSRYKQTVTRTAVRVPPGVVLKEEPGPLGGRVLPLLDRHHVGGIGITEGDPR